MSGSFSNQPTTYPALPPLNDNYKNGATNQQQQQIPPFQPVQKMVNQQIEQQQATFTTPNINKYLPPPFTTTLNNSSGSVQTSQTTPVHLPPQVRQNISMTNGDGSTHSSRTASPALNNSFNNLQQNKPPVGSVNNSISGTPRSFSPISATSTVDALNQNYQNIDASNLNGSFQNLTLSGIPAAVNGINTGPPINNIPNHNILQPQQQQQQQQQEQQKSKEQVNKFPTNFNFKTSALNTIPTTSASGPQNPNINQNVYNSVLPPHTIQPNLPVQNFSTITQPTRPQYPPLNNAFATMSPAAIQSGTETVATNGTIKMPPPVVKTTNTNIFPLQQTNAPNSNYNMNLLNNNGPPMPQQEFAKPQQFPGYPPQHNPGLSQQPPPNQSGLSKPPQNPVDLSQPPLNQVGFSRPQSLNQFGLPQPPSLNQAELSKPPSNQFGLSQQPSQLNPGLSQPPLNQTGLSRPPPSNQFGLPQPPLNQAEFSKPPLHQVGLSQTSQLNPGFSQQSNLNEAVLSQPNLNQVGLTQPPQFNPGLSQSNMNQAALSQPNLNQVGLTQPPQLTPGLSQSNVSHAAMSQPNLNQVGLSQPPQYNHGLPQPQQSQSGLSKPPLNQVGLSKPPLNQSEFSQPSQNQSGMSQPPLNQVGLTQPPQNQAGLSQPSQNHPGLTQTHQQQPGIIQPTQHIPGLPPAAQQQAGISQPPPPLPPQQQGYSQTQQHQPPPPPSSGKRPMYPTQQYPQTQAYSQAYQPTQQQIHPAMPTKPPPMPLQQPQSPQQQPPVMQPHPQQQTQNYNQQQQQQQQYQQPGINGQQQTQYQNQNQKPQQIGPPNLSVTHQGFNRLWGQDTFDLMQHRHILSPTTVETPRIVLNNQFHESVNVNPDVMRCTLNKIPDSNSLLQKTRLPLGLLIHPFRDINSLPVIQCPNIVRCRLCRTYINPFVYFVDSKMWKCNLCYRINELPEDFQYDPATKTYGDVTRRPEVRSSTIEFIAPSEYMLRPPQPAIYLFLFDVSILAQQSGYLETACSVVSKHLDDMPGDARTQVGFIAYNSAIHFYNMADGYNQPHEMTLLDIDDPFLPCPDNLLVNLKECKELVKDLLSQLPQRFAESHDPGSCMGSALQVAFKLMMATGGRVTVFQTCLPNKGAGALESREDPNNRSSQDVAHLNPATDFYKRHALECSGYQIAVDLFVLNQQYIDLASISGISKHCGGSVHHIPLFQKTRPHQVNSFKQALKRYLTRKIGFEAVMRIRCTRGLQVHTFHGNFFVRSTDLLSLPNVNPDAGYGMQISYEESLADVKTICFQAALLYTNSEGERRIRVHTLCLPVTSNLSETLHAADAQAIVGLLSKMAVDRSLASNVADAREAFINATIDILSAYKLAQNFPPGTTGQLMAPRNLSLLPLYILALLKHIAFRVGKSTRLDDRVAAMDSMKTLPLDQFMKYIYPEFYVIDCLFYNISENLDDEDNQTLPPYLQLTAEFIDSRSMFLIDSGQLIIIYVGLNVPSKILESVLGVKTTAEIPDICYGLPDINTPENESLKNFINSLNEDKPYLPTIQIIRDTSTVKSIFMEKLVDDRSESSLSYYEFLQHLRTQVK